MIEWLHKLNRRSLYAIHQAQNQLFELIDDVSKGAEIIITKQDKALAKLVSACPAKKERIFGLMKDEIKMADDFDSPLCIK